MRKAILIALCILAAVVIAQKVPTNQGMGMPDNGPCIAPVNQGVGLCNDQQTSAPGILVAFDNNGKKYPIPLPGPTGPQGEPGPQGPPGTVLGMQLTGSVVCTPGVGTIPKGYKATCTFTITGMQ